MSTITSATTPDLTQTPFLNISCYKFVALENLPTLREALLSKCEQLELRGTILLSHEGINVFVSGLPENVAALVDTLKQLPEFSDIEPKESYSATQPFRRMLVRLKQEIIAFGVDGICPEKQTSQKLPAQELKKWYDEGRPFRILDTRNDYEVELGTFRGAEHLNIGHFRNFPTAIEKLPPEAKKEPLVMFCTGGIRCEKAGPLMEEAGFESVYQLDGGILKYFEECGGAHYDGSCFVFDGRVALDPELKPTGNLLCFACQAVLTVEDVESEQFLFGKHCPKCFQDPQNIKSREFVERQQEIVAIASSQPGCEPYTKVRRIFVAGEYDSMTLIDFLDHWHPQTGKARWQEWIDAEQIHYVSQGWTTRTVASADQIVKAGECFEHTMPDTTEPRINPAIQLLYEDESILVVNKPAPLPCQPSGQFSRNSLTAIIGQVYPNEKLRIAHPVDVNASGVVVLCRKHQSAKIVQPQFRDAKVEKRYVARVQEHPEWNSRVCDCPIGNATSDRGSRCVDTQGLSANTEFVVLQRLDDKTAIVEAIPTTNQTHQIRVHLAHLGHAIVGDPLYAISSNKEPPASPIFNCDEPPMCLHATSLTFTHPESKLPVTFSTPLPDWAAEQQ